MEVVENWCNEHGKKVVRMKRTPRIASPDIKQNLTRVGHKNLSISMVSAAHLVFEGEVAA